jgi:4-diphosphocytidyl-2-C-methyl-D-erythritol kinase
VRPLTGAERLGIAAHVGSDVPLFLVGGAVLGRGRGEEVAPMPDLSPTHCLLALPAIGVSTPQAFRDWDARHASFPAASSQTASSLAASSLTAVPASDRLNELSRTLASVFGEPHSSGVFAAGEGLAGNSGSEANPFAGTKNPLLALVQTGIENDFEEVVFPQNPLFGQIKRALCGPNPSPDASPDQALYAALSGSGSALFGLYATLDAAAAAEARLDEMGVRSLRTETLPRDAYWQRMLVE